MNRQIKLFFVLAFVFTSFSSFASGKKDTLFAAVESGTEKEIKSFLKDNPEYVNIRDGAEKVNPLMTALKADRPLSVIKILLKYDAQPMQLDSSKRNSIMYAAEYSTDPKVLEKIIKSTSFFKYFRARNILKKDINGKTSFDYARENPVPEQMLSVLNMFTAEKIPEEKAKEENKTKETQDQLLPPTPEEEETVEVNQEAPAEEEGQTEVQVPVPLPSLSVTSEATQSQDKTTAQQQAQELDIQEKENTTPLFDFTSVTQDLQEQTDEESSAYSKTYLFDFACDEEQDTEVPQASADDIHTFIENADAKDLSGRTKLMLASKKGNLELAENLIYSKADVNAQDNDGWTPLMFAARFSASQKMIKLLIKNGADIKHKNNYGVTSLRLAAGFSASPAIVAELLNAYEATDSEVLSAFIYAVSSSAPAQILEAFYKKGIPLNAAYEGKTALMYAAESNKDTKTLAWLLSKGAKKTYRTRNGMTAFDFAKQNKKLPHDEIYWTLNISGE